MKIIRYISLSLICIILTTSLLCSCNVGNKKTPPPALADIREELILRIENSKQVNEIFWGDGLPVIPIGSKEAEEVGLYTEQNLLTTDDYGEWEYVDPSRTALISIDAIKALAETAYSDSFLKGVYTAQFDGLYDPVSATALDPHYYESESWIWKNANSKEEFPSIAKTRTFDFDSMKLDEDKSSGERIYVTLNCYFEGETESEKTTLAFDKQEDGWYLSSPTY